ncbi:MAG: 50S ribosomal protein L3 [Clostridia bacterium]|nr:50S ribosomal protein L3 [Deltaproteobacteria bacterium]
MTQIFDVDGRAIGVTILEMGPNLVMNKRTKATNKNGKTDGYTALQIGFGLKAERLLSSPEKGVLALIGGHEKARRYVREMRVSEETVSKFELGAEITLKDVEWKAGDLIDCVGQTKGKGFQGVVRRYKFAGFNSSHGTHEYFRHGGSIGCRKWPGRVIKGRRMPGHMGDDRVTTQNVRIAAIREDLNVVLVHGSVPGAKNGLVMVRLAVKKHPHA